MALGDNRKAIEYVEKDSNIVMEIGHRAEEGATYGNLGYNYRSLG